MHLDELSSFVGVKDCDCGYSSSFQLLAEVGFDSELVEDVAEKVVDLFFSNLVMEITHYDLHSDGLCNFQYYEMANSIFQSLDSEGNDFVTITVIVIL